MSIIQISKILHRSGNLVDLPQLDAAELGWANDNKRLFIGTSIPNPPENVEVLTSYSNISFSQIDGSGGNLNVTDPTDGQVLAFDGDNWVNRGGDSGGIINLGDTSNIKIAGGAIGYILETDGTGNLSWTSKGSSRVNIEALSDTTPIVMTVLNTTPYINRLAVAISSVEGDPGITSLNGDTFYISLSEDFSTSGNVYLYTDTGLTIPSDGTGLTYTNAPNAIAMSSLSGSAGVAVGGANTTVQFNNANLIDGSPNFVFDFITNILKVTGTANVSANVNAGNVVSSGVVRALGNVIGANLMGVFANGVSNVNMPVVSGNINMSVAGNANVVVVTDTGINIAGYANITGNITSGNANLGNLVIANYFSGNGISLYSINGANVYGATTLAITANNLAGGTVGAIPYQSAPNVTNFVTPVPAGNYLISNDAAIPVWSPIISPGNGAITVSTGTAATNVSVSLQMSNAFGANSTTDTVMSANVGPALGNLTSAMGNASTGFLKKTAADTYSFESSTYSESSNLAAVTGRGNNTSTQIITTNSTSSTSTGSGAITVTGGVGIGGNVWAGNFYTAGIVQTPALSTGSSVTGGTITGNWILSGGSRLNATYADLAERYVADGYYIPGTILDFGGENEVTLSEANSTRVAGVISTNPAYVMNVMCEGAYVVDVALQGRVPVLVVGSISKGDMIISAGGGYGCACAFPRLGQIIGKSLENRHADSDNNIIEVAIGRH